MLLSCSVKKLSALCSVALLGLIACTSSPSVQTPSTGTSTSSKTRANTPVNNASPPKVVSSQTKVSDIRNKLGGSYNLKAPVRRQLKGGMGSEVEGVNVPFLEFSGGFDVDNDGAENRNVATKVNIAGLGEHEVVLNIEDYPVMDNRDDTYVITDKQLKNSTTLEMDQDLFNYTLKKTNIGFNTKQIVGGLSVNTQPDGTWLVNGEVARTPEEVAKIAIQTPLIQNMSIHSVALLLTSVRSAANKAPKKYIDLPYKNIDKDLLVDVGDLVDEDKITAFEYKEFFEDKDLEDVDNEAFFNESIDFGEDEEEIEYEGEFLSDQAFKNGISNAGIFDDDSFNEVVDETIPNEEVVDENTSDETTLDEEIFDEEFNDEDFSTEEDDSTMISSAPVQKDPIWGDLYVRSLGSMPAWDTASANEYGNPEPLLEALLKLMKAQRAS